MNKKNSNYCFRLSLCFFTVMIMTKVSFAKHLILASPILKDEHVASNKNRFSNMLKKCSLIPRTLTAEESQGDVYQLLLHFEKPIHFEKECNNENSTIKLSFYNINKIDFEAKKMVELCKKISFIKRVSIDVESHPLARTIVLLEFMPESALVKIQKSNDSHMISIDCYDKKILEKIKNGTDILRMACNQPEKTVLPRFA